MCDCRKSSAALGRFSALGTRLRFGGCCKPDPCDPCGAGRFRALAVPTPDPFLMANPLRLGIR